MWFSRKKVRPETLLIDPIVEEAKRRTHVLSKAAQRGADRLNDQFVENHITLMILRTAGGDKHGR